MPVAVQGPRTVVRYQHHPVPPRSSRTIAQTSSWATAEEEEQPAPPERRPTRRRRPHALFIVGLGVLVMILGWQLLTLLGVWWQNTQDDWRYGYPRTYQTDANVGHGGVSHFLAQNLHGHLYVEELPDDDPAHAKMYVIPLTASGPQSDLIPVTVQVRDVNGDGKPDLIVLVGQERFIFVNDHGAFRPLKPGEHVSL